MPDYTFICLDKDCREHTTVSYGLHDDKPHPPCKKCGGPTKRRYYTGVFVFKKVENKPGAKAGSTETFTETKLV